MPVLPPTLVASLSARPGIRIEKVASNRTVYLGFNVTDPVLSNLKLRKAIDHAIDREAITAKLTHAPANGAAIGGLKVCTENGWFAARPSGTEDLYKIYAESFKGEEHLRQIQAEAREIVNAALV